LDDNAHISWCSVDFSYHVSKNIRELIFNVNMDIVITINYFYQATQCVYISILGNSGLYIYPYLISSELFLIRCCMQKTSSFFLWKPENITWNEHWFIMFVHLHALVSYCLVHACIGLDCLVLHRFIHAFDTYCLVHQSCIK
jgi:hypothetical protein